MLPPLILKELFDLSHRPTDVVIDYLCEEIEEHGHKVKQVFDYDSAIIIELDSTAGVGELRIDRIQRLFIITLRHDAEFLLPTSGDWGVVIKCLTLKWE